MNRTHLWICTAAAALIAGCSSLTLRPADFSWPIEVVVKVDSKGMVQDNRYSFSFNAKELIFEETHDSTSVNKVTLRLIRDARGYFFVTADKFKNVYVFSQGDGSLRMENKIMVSEKGVNDPAFNQRPPFIQLVIEGEKTVTLSRDGIQQGAK